MTPFAWFLIICVLLFIISACLSYDRRKNYLKLKIWWSRQSPERQLQVLPGLQAYWDVMLAKRPGSILGEFLNEIGGEHENKS